MDASKWTPNDVPDQLTDHAFISLPASDNADITLGAPISIGTLTISAAQPKLTIQNTGNLSVGVTEMTSADAELLVQSGGRFASNEFSTQSLITVDAGGTFSATHYLQTSAHENVFSGTLDVSAGSIELNQGGLTAGAGGMIRSNAIAVSDASELTIRSGGQLQTSTFTSNGLLRLDNGKVTSTNAMQFNDVASVIGTGTLSSVQINDFSVVSPGSRSGPIVTAGDLHITGDLEFQSSDTNYVSDITATGHDTIHVDGDAILSTFLVVPVNGSFIPATGSEYVILTADSIDITGLTYDVANSPNRILISNDDGEIGSFELVDRLNGLNADELVLTDFQPVPETGLGLVIGAALALVARRPRRS